MIEITGTLKPGLKNQSGKRLSLHQQLLDRLKGAILTGRLGAGTYLNASRTLAAELGVSRNTVVSVYEHLIAEGYLIADRAGTRVADLGTHVAGLSNANSDTAPHASNAHTSLAEKWRSPSDIPTPRSADTFQLSPGTPSITDFPLKRWKGSLERSVKHLSQHALTEHHPLGDPALRRAIASHLQVSRGVRCSYEQIIVTRGAQQALELCLTLLTDPGDTIWIEDPCYSGLRRVVAGKTFDVCAVPVDREGITIPLKDNANTPKLIFTTPAHQYPTGAVLSASRRLQLIEYAGNNGSWIIEDDYDGDFRHQGLPINSMQGLTNDAPVIYIGSFSKTMYNRLRLGFLVLPESILQPATEVLKRLLTPHSPLQQIALADFIQSGEFGKHLSRMRRVYRKQLKALRVALHHSFPGCPILGGEAGMHLTLILPGKIDDEEISRLARESHIDVLPLSRCYSSNPAHLRGLIIGYGNTAAEHIPDAVEKLAQIIKTVAR